MHMSICKNPHYSARDQQQTTTRQAVDQPYAEAPQP